MTKRDACYLVPTRYNIANANPIRYRGYYYDNETGFYYVSSRYYDPEIGRFINADSQLNQKDGILGYNMFAYCHNNPIMYSDPTGHSITLACIIIGAVIGAVAGGCAGAYVSKKQTGKVNGWAVAAGAVGGGVGGIDTPIFKSGTLTVPYEMLEAFNEAVAGTIQIMP